MENNTGKKMFEWHTVHFYATGKELFTLTFHSGYSLEEVQREVEKVRGALQSYCREFTNYQVYRHEKYDVERWEIRDRYSDRPKEQTDLA